MATDYDYWKNKYKDMWGISSEREINISNLISELTGFELIAKGLGAESTKFISGAATSHGGIKGDADYQVEGTNIFIEITGPLVTSVSENAALWFRPDKIENAIRNRNVHDTWLIHHLPKNNLLRVVHITPEFITAYMDREFPIVTPVIRGTREKYLEIPSDSHFVEPFDNLIMALNA